MSRISPSLLALLLSGCSGACLYYYYKFDFHHRLASPFARHQNRKYDGNPCPKSQGKIFFISERCKMPAIRLRGMMSYFGVEMDVVDFNGYIIHNLPNEKLILFVVSFGKDRNLSSNLNSCIRWFLKNNMYLSPQLLEACRFSVLEFGSHVDEESTAMRNLIMWMCSYGASEILPIRKVNQDTEYMDPDFSTWCEELVRKLRIHEIDEPKETDEFRANPYCSNLDDEKIFEGCLDDEQRLQVYDAEQGLESVDDEQRLVTCDDERLDSYDDELVDPFDDEQILDPVDDDQILDHNDEDGDGSNPNEEGDGINTNPTSGTSAENKLIHIYVLLKHEKEGKTNDKADAFPVTSLYRYCVNTIDDTNDTPVYPPALPLFNFDHDKYPSDMGCGAIGRTLFFIGGDHHSSNKGTSNKMYILDTSLISDSSSEHDISKIIQTKSCTVLNKCDPIVATVRSKLIVLPDNFGSKDGMNPTIECYNHQEDRWESFDIFQIYNGRGSVKTNPLSSPEYKVLAHSVKDSKIFICLRMEAYAFDVDTGNLYLVGHLGDICPREPFSGMCVYSGGWFFGLSLDSRLLHLYIDNPFLGKKNNKFVLKASPWKHLLPELNAENVQGLISNLGKKRGLAELLVVRSGQTTDEAQISRIDLVFNILEVSPYRKCRDVWSFVIYDITYHVDTRNGPIVDIKACIPIVQETQIAATVFQS